MTSRQINAHPEMSIDPAERACWNCEFFLVRGDIPGERFAAGFCVRYPPRFQIEDAMNDGFPFVGPQTWCGEFRKAPEPRQ